ncbi:unnamed protein product, partial [Dicrocoelium dendriticum]
MAQQERLWKQQTRCGCNMPPRFKGLATKRSSNLCRLLARTNPHHFYRGGCIAKADVSTQTQLAGCRHHSSRGTGSSSKPTGRTFSSVFPALLRPESSSRYVEAWNNNPIHKGGSRTDPSNYRPVSLLPILSKVMESIVADALVCYLENCNIITPEQHGFRRQRSCTTNLLIARSSWTEAADAGEGVDVIYLDFSKAFDRLDHRILLSKLQHYGIGDPLLSWIANFLLQRQLVVRVRSSLSNPIQVECGVPQGSVL